MTTPNLKLINGGDVSSDSSGGGVTSEFVMQCLEANELGDGMLYAALHQNQYVYSKNSDQWYYWNGHAWRRDDLDRAEAAVENVAIRYAKEIERLGVQLSKAMAEGDESAQKAIKDKIGQIHKRVRRLRTDTGRRHCLKFAHTNPQNPLAIHGKEFDQDPWLLACANGVINLRTGELEPGRPEDCLSKRSPVEWQGIDADAGPWEQMLLEIHDGDEDLVAYKQRLYGYGITGLTIEHVFPVFFGRGRNGKSVEIETISYVLGDYAGTVPAEMLLDSHRQATANQSSPEIMALKGLRLAIASETDEGRRFSPARVKWLTGGDTLTGRGLYDRHLTEFVPTHLLILLTNHKPAAPETDYAFWERCALIPYKISFVDREPKEPHERRADKDLPRKLRECAPGILAWLVRGCLLWQRHGLAPPKSVLQATREYLEDENYMSRFIEAACVVESGARTSAADLYAAFVIWFRENVNPKKSYTPAQKGFTQKIMALERFPRIKSRGYYHFLGLRLNDEWAGRILEGED